MVFKLMFATCCHTWAQTAVNQTRGRRRQSTKHVGADGNQPNACTNCKAELHTTHEQDFTRCKALVDRLATKPTSRCTSMAQCLLGDMYAPFEP